MKFTIEVDMQDRWVGHFISMLKTMQYLGGIGSSRVVGFYADGDGDFRPKFNFSNLEHRVKEAKPVYDMDTPHDKRDAVCAIFYDAG
jgi:hypothetical protein